MDVGWAHGAQHMWRSHGVCVEHAMEAIHDVDALLYDPDPKSKSAKSAPAGLLIEPEQCGCDHSGPQGRSPRCMVGRDRMDGQHSRHQSVLEGEPAMNTLKEVESAAAEAEATITEPMPEGLKPTRPNKSVPVAVRLSPQDVSAVEKLASALDVSVSTLIRGWIRQGLAARAENTVDAALDQIAADVQRLRELVA